VTLAAAAALAGLAAASLPLYSHPDLLTQFGYVTSIVPKGKSYIVRFDPAFWLEGDTANVAAAEAGEIKPGQSVPNDYFILNPDHKLLTYKLPANAHVTVLAYLQTTKVSVATLAHLLNTTKSCSGNGKYNLRPPCRLGFWLMYRIDTVTALNQQYQP
jgi:hypothetical protein